MAHDSSKEGLSLENSQLTSKENPAQENLPFFPLLIPRKRRKQDGHFVVFLAIALLLHVLFLGWLWKHEAYFKQQSLGKIFKVQLVNIPPPPPPKPKPLPPPPKPKIKPIPQKPTAKPPAPLKLQQVHFHVSKKTNVPTENSNLVGTTETKNGSIHGNPEGVFGGKPSATPMPSPTPTSTPTPKPTPTPTPTPVGPTRDAKPIFTVLPTIPDSLRSQPYESEVVVKVIIYPNGTFKSSLLTSSGNPDVDKRVLEALQQWKWEPALKNGVPVLSIQIFKFDFQVE
jgi:TonB family protein